MIHCAIAHGINFIEHKEESSPTRGFLHLGSHWKTDSDQLACSRKGKDLYAQSREAQHVNKRYQPFLFKGHS